MKRGSTLEIYQDSELHGSAEDTIGSTASNTNTLWIGCRASNRYHFNGALDSLMIYNRALTKKELQVLIKLDKEL